MKLFLALAFASSLVFPAVASEEIAQLKATVVKVSGDVSIRSRGSLVSHDAKANEILSAGDQIETKEKGKIELKIENGNVINLKPKSKLVLKTLTRDLKTGDYENLFEVNSGGLRAKVEKIKGKSRFEVKSPTAVACVRGTIMYLLVYPDSTTAFFEEGVGFVTNPFSGQAFDVNPGNVYQIDENGNVTGPVIPTSEQLQEIIEGWDVGGGAEGYSEAGGDDLEGYTGPNDNSDDATDDRRNSRDSDFGSGENNTGGGTTISGGTGTLTGTDTDTDGDGIFDIEDAFPIIPNPSTDPNVYGSRDSIRDKIAKTGSADTGFVNFGTYNPVTGIFSGGIYGRMAKLDGEAYGTDIDPAVRDEIRNDMQEMLRDQETRYLDSVMERITDAQTAKVLTDAYGYRVRVEQYVLRPNSNTVELLNVSLRTQEAGSLAGLNTLDWKTTFNNSLDALSSSDIKNLPWSDYLDSYGTSIRSTSATYPTTMTIALNKGSESLSENTTFGSRQHDHGEDHGDGQWYQDVTAKTLSFNLTDIGTRTGLDIKNVVTPGNPTPNSNHPVYIKQVSASDAPDGFRYHVYLGSGNTKSIYVSFNVISDAGTNVSSGYNSKHFDTLGDALRANLAGATSRNIGSNNLELTISSKSRTDPNFAGSRLIDVIYTPLPRMTWSDINWGRD